jgi:outer membrane protein OmpA-like peptidoglycan-associated protein
MELSQARTRSVLFFVQGLPQIQADRDWVKRNIAAVGLSSSKLILDAKGVEDPERSRRVTFRVITNAETQIRRLIQD